MRIFDTYREYQSVGSYVAFRGPDATMAHFSKVAFRCDTCNAIKLISATGGTTYAVTRQGEFQCYACADDAQRADMLDRSRPFTCYVGNQARVTTWTGGTLGYVYKWSESRSGWHWERIDMGAFTDPKPINRRHLTRR